MEKLLIIGAGIGQINIIKKAQKMGFHVTVVSQPGNYPGLDLADDIIYCDIYDREKIVDLAKEHHINAVTSDQNDLMMPTVAYIAEKLELPGNTFAQVMSYCNKNNFRDNCDKLNIPVPKHISVNSDDYNFSEFNCRLPWIVKPADSQSSVGVQRIDKMCELQPALEFALSKSPTNSAIVEEFFKGKEIVCEGYVENGKYYLLGFADRKYFKLDNLMIPAQTIFPSTVNTQILEKIVTYEERMAEYIAPSFAIIHSEYLINEESGEIRVVESALRGGGVYISSHLIPLATGIDVNEILLKKAMGKTVDVENLFKKRKSAAAGYVCFYLPEGIVQSVKGIEELRTYDFLKLMSLDDMKIGEKCYKMLHKGMRKGPILVYGNDREELEKNIMTVRNTLQIEVVTDKGTISNIIWE